MYPYQKNTSQNYEYRPEILVTQREKSDSRKYGFVSQNHTKLRKYEKVFKKFTDFAVEKYPLHIPSLISVDTIMYNMMMNSLTTK